MKLTDTFDFILHSPFSENTISSLTVHCRSVLAYLRDGGRAGRREGEREGETERERER
jgi:hypothetical protein